MRASLSGAQCLPYCHCMNLVRSPITLVVIDVEHGCASTGGWATTAQFAKQLGDYRSPGANFGEYDTKQNSTVHLAKIFMVLSFLSALETRY